MSTSSVPRALLEVRYFQAAQEYLRRLTDENHMEATVQAYQRKVTLESLDLVSARRSEVQVFNELLVQYPKEGTRQPGQVVPDNMVVLYDRPLQVEGSYDVPLQPVSPFWVLEYVSKNSRRKDYELSMAKYEHQLKVPYYLLFVPDEQEMTLYRHTGEKYVSVKPDAQERDCASGVGVGVGAARGLGALLVSRRTAAAAGRPPTRTRPGTPGPSDRRTTGRGSTPGSTQRRTARSEQSRSCPGCASNSLGCCNRRRCPEASM